MGTGCAIGNCRRRPLPATRVPLVIVGGGIAGLSAAWRLQQRGFRDFVLLEMEREAGGNARSGQQRRHRVSLGRALRAGPGRTRRWCASCSRSSACSTTAGGTTPSVPRAARAAVPARPLASRLRAAGGTDRTRPRSRHAFRGTGWRRLRAAGHSPCRWATRWPPRRLTAISMAQWLTAGGPRFALAALVGRLRVPRRLRRTADRHGGVGRNPLLRVARASRKLGPLTWPEGNGWITRRLLAMAGDRVKTGPGSHARDARGQALGGLHARGPLDGRGRDFCRALVSGGASDRRGAGDARLPGTRPGSPPTSRSIAGRRNAACPSRGTT